MAEYVLVHGELYHYGVLGMKWGVRRYQRKDGTLTPAGERRRAKREKRSAKYHEANKQIRSEIKALKSKEKQTLLDRRKISKLEEKHYKNAEKANDIEQHGMTKTQKRVLIGATVVAAYATFKFLDSGTHNQLIARGKKALGKADLGFKTNSRLSRKNMNTDEIMSEVVSRINPGYGGIGTKNNCRRCTFAYEMSRRGYDVKATKSVKATGQTLIGVHNATNKDDQIRGGVVGFYGKLLKNSKDTKKYNALVSSLTSKSNEISTSLDNDYGTAIFSALSKQPNGARGELSMMWKMGGGHSVAWEIVNGKPVIFDCQSGKKFETVQDLYSYSSNTKSASFIRLDNLPMNEDFLTRWLHNA